MQEQIAINAALIAVRQAAKVVCDRATLLLLLQAHGGDTRYADFSLQTGLASRLLSARLAQMTQDGLLVRMPYSRRPLRHAYHLTHMGTALFDVLALLATWEQTWPDPAQVNRRVQLVHVNCQASGEPRAANVLAKAHCAACGTPVSAREITLHVSAKEMARMPDKSTSTRRTSESVGQKAGSTSALLPQALAVLGDKWSIEVMVAAFFRVRQFGEFGTHLGISSNILADRLARLVNLGLLSQQVDEGAARKGAYLLTAKGRDFYAVLIAIESWADAWIDRRVRSPVKLRHIRCRNGLQLQLKCGACGHALNFTNARLVLASTISAS